MANFDWRRARFEAAVRYSQLEGEDLVGLDAWRELINAITRDRPDRPADTEQWVRQDLLAFDNFLAAVQDTKRPESMTCRVFVSHQQQDVRYAERIAWLANKKDFEYWLDVHDPVLTLANGLALPPHAQSILIAVIVEMALLNCSHVIAVQTAQAAKSRWVPYEYGRVKQRMLQSTQAASWFDNGIHPVNSADYLQLGVCAWSEADVVQWLGFPTKSVCQRRSQDDWPVEPPRLPN